MHDCCSQEGHTKCKPVPFAPLRLLTVGLNGESIKLVERDTTTVRAEYTTLSYCWGSSIHLCTTKETLPTFREGIPLDLIPKTLADAIYITRALGIPHLWIDALCIVQDDEEEWQHEAANMFKIYQGSQLTISAVQSRDSSQGCFPFNECNPQNAQVFFRTRPDDSNGHRSIVRVYRGDIRDSTMVDSAISSRGWILQEQLLSPRLVFVMQSEVHWHCQAGYQTQSGLSFEPVSTLPSRTMVIPCYSLQLDDQWYRIA